MTLRFDLVVCKGLTKKERLVFFTVRNEVAKVIFLQAYVCPYGGCLPQCMLGYPPEQTPLEQTPPRNRHPPEQTPPPGSRHPQSRHSPGSRHPQSRHTPPSPEQTSPQETATAADGMHPTGMHSCFVPCVN